MSAPRAVVWTMLNSPSMTCDHVGRVLPDKDAPLSHEGFYQGSLYPGCTGSLLPLRRLSLVLASEGYSIIAVSGLLTAVASLVAEHGL